MVIQLPRTGLRSTAAMALMVGGLLMASPLLNGAQARPMGGGFGGRGGPASGAGVRPGAGWGAAGAGVRPGAGVGLTRAPGASAWNQGWAGRGYWSARSWSTGWYRPYPAAWPWWRNSSVAWGLTGLATAAAITGAVDAAAEQQSTVIVVPQTSLQLDYGSIQAQPPNGVSFAYAPAGTSYLNATSDCKLGLLNGVPPTTADQAQLLNATCQIAYGSA